MNYIRQLIYDMRHQKMMTWVSISGTAVSIFLVLVFYMVNSLPTVEVAPETKRDLIYGAPLLNVEVISGEKQGWSITGSGMSYPYAEQLFENLEGVEVVSYVFSYPNQKNVNADGKPPVMAMMKTVDGTFWKLYDFQFINGRPFSNDECLNNKRLPIVLTHGLARKLFGSIDVIDRTMNVNGVTYHVVGVVENTSPILKNTYAEAYLPLDESSRQGYEDPEFIACGSISPMLKFSETTDKEAVMRQLNSRIATINTELSKIGSKASLRELQAPEQMGALRSWGRTNSVDKIAKRHYLVYVLLLLLPAINLSSMMRGRLQDRISEIGVRRAYGARRRNIIYQLLGENFLVTIAGGVIGLLLSYLFMMFLSSSFIPMVDGWWITSLDIRLSTPTFSMLFSWQAFALTVAACLVLNILTASVPAWRAASIPPSAAISKSRN